MTYDKNWTFQNNTAPTSSGSSSAYVISYCLQLKQFLVSVAGWTVESSSNSVSAGNSDYWNSASDIVGSYSGENGYPHSWVVLKSPEGIVAGPDGSYTGNQSRLWFSVSVPMHVNYGALFFRFHRVSPTGGDISTTPSSSDQIKKDNYFAIFNDGSASRHFHFSCTDKGNFYALVARSGVGRIDHALGLLPISDPSKINSSGLDYPYGAIVLNGFINFYVGPLHQVYLAGTNSSQCSIQGWNRDGSTTANNARVLVLGNGAGVNESESSNTSSWIGYSFPTDGDSINHLQLFGQAHVQLETPGKSAYLGRLADIYGSGSNIPQLSVDNVSSPTMQFFGNLWLPTNVVMGA